MGARRPRLVWRLVWCGRGRICLLFREAVVLPLGPRSRPSAGAFFVLLTALVASVFLAEKRDDVGHLAAVVLRKTTQADIDDIELPPRSVTFAVYLHPQRMAAESRKGTQAAGEHDDLPGACRLG
jgi:hypothetical protein